MSLFEADRVAQLGPTLDQHLDLELRDPRYPRLILNLSHLSFFGVAGLTSLLRARDLAHDQHTRLHLVGSRPVDRLLRLSALHDQFTSCPDLATALAAAPAAVRAGTHTQRPPASTTSHPLRAQVRVP